MLGYSGVFVFLMVTAPVQLAAGAWVQMPGAYYFKLSANYLSTSEEFDHRGERLAILAEDPGFADASLKDLNVTLYGEYGWRPGGAAWCAISSLVINTFSRSVLPPSSDCAPVSQFKLNWHTP